MKKLFYFAAMAAMVVSFAACGNKTEQSEAIDSVEVDSVVVDSLVPDTVAVDSVVVAE